KPGPVVFVHGGEIITDRSQQCRSKGKNNKELSYFTRKEMLSHISYIHLRIDQLAFVPFTNPSVCAVDTSFTSTSPSLYFDGHFMRILLAWNSSPTIFPVSTICSERSMSCGFEPRNTTLHSVPSLSYI